MASFNGRPSDPVRKFLMKGDGMKDKCLGCRALVSNKTSRLKAHLAKCPLSKATPNFRSDDAKDPAQALPQQSIHRLMKCLMNHVKFKKLGAHLA